MRIKRSKLLIAMITVILALLAWIVPSSETARAATTDIQPLSSIPVSGLDAGDAVVTNSSGNVVQNGDTMYTWEKFKVDYQWSIANDVPIKAGDTAPFTLPDGISSSGDLNNIPMYNDEGVQIGTFTLKAGQKTGTITFNDAFSSATQDREGTLHFNGTGTQTNTESPGHFDWTVNKIGWLNEYDENGLPKYVVWNIAFNPNSQKLSNVVITDTLGPGQTYVNSSVNASAGSFSDNGNFVPNGSYLTPKVTVNGDKIMFDFGNIDTAVNMTFRVEIEPKADAGNNWYDNASLSSDQVSGSVGSDVSWGGSGTGTGNILGNIIFEKRADNTGNPLPGAVYELSDYKGNVIMSSITTDENGSFSIHDLPVGTYVLKEIKAPDGYALNTEPITFSVMGDTSIPIDLEQSDSLLRGTLGLTKYDGTTGDALAGAVYNLLDSEGHVIKYGLTTDANGALSVSGLKLGKYSLVETSAPEGYLVNKNPIEFDLTSGNNYLMYQANDYPISSGEDQFGNLDFTKTDATTGFVVPNAVYELRDANDKIMKNITTNQEGKIYLEGLAEGKYSLVEIKAPEGYVLDKTPIYFEIKANQTVDASAKDSQELPTNPGVTPPTEPENPEEPEIPGVTPPTEPENPEEPEIPGVTPPTEPEKPEEPEPEPEEPENPIEPEKPTYPEEPSDQNDEELPSVKPLEPSPSVPIKPGQPGVITEPNFPETSQSGGSTSTGKGRFPQTGDAKTTLIIVAGFAVLMFVLGRIIRKYDK